MTTPRSLLACKRTHFTALALASFMFSGCETTSSSTSAKIHPEASQAVAQISTTAVVPPEIKLHQLSAGGVREQRGDWTQAARTNARATLESMRPETMVYIKDVSLTPEITAEIAEVQALYRTIDANITMFGNPAVGLTTAIGRFDFSVGSVDRICEAVGADALLLIYGEDDYFTGGRKFMTGLGVVASIAATAMTGTPVMMTPSRGKEHISAALVAREGTLLWYEVLGPDRIGDLRDENGLKTTIHNLLQSMPAGRASR